jgi:hypothetical protein
VKRLSKECPSGLPAEKAIIASRMKEMQMSDVGTEPTLHPIL